MFRPFKALEKIKTHISFSWGSLTDLFSSLWPYIRLSELLQKLANITGGKFGPFMRAFRKQILRYLFEAFCILAERKRRRLTKAQPEIVEELG